MLSEFRYQTFAISLTKIEVVQVLHTLLRIQRIHEVVTLTFWQVFCSNLLGKRRFVELRCLLAEVVAPR